MADFLGHSNIFATLSLSLSLSLSGTNSQSTYLIYAHTCVNVWLSLQKCKGRFAVFIPFAYPHPQRQAV